MSIKPRYLQGQPTRRSILLDDCRLAPLEHVAPGNLSEAVRYCIQYALERGALDAAQLKHTPAQRAAVAKMRAAAITESQTHD